MSNVSRRLSRGDRRRNDRLATRLWLSERTIEGHVATIMNKLGIQGADGHRRVLVVLAFLRSSTDPAGDG